MSLRDATEELLAHAAGRSDRDDAVLEHTGGPAGNARLTAWTGLLLLVLIGAEFVTLLDVRGLISWHIVIGVLLIPPALLKTGTTAWRIIRYYSGNRAYHDAGPPPMVLRLLGPLVVVSTLAVLGTGVALILLKPETVRDGLVNIGPLAISPLFLHKATFVVWAAVTGVHTLGRLIPALRLTLVPAVTRRVPGRLGRTATLSLTAAVAVLAAVLALSVAGPWRAPNVLGHFDRDGRIHSDR